MFEKRLSEATQVAESWSHDFSRNRWRALLKHLQKSL